jgi:hypothetical protein
MAWNTTQVTTKIKEINMYKKIALASAILLSLTGCATATNTAQDVSCIKLIVDYSSLNPTGNFSQCIQTNGTENALPLVVNAGFDITGTDKYGTQIVCRVNDFPSATGPLGIADHKDYVEPCKDMPPSFAYWALLVKTSGSSKWGWAETGISDLKLNPGDAVALVFSENGETKFPND